MSEIKFETNTDIFYSGIATVARAIQGNSPIPSQNGIKIEVTSDSLILTGTGDYSIRIIINNEIKKEANLKIEKSGIFILETKVLLEILKNVKSDEIKIESIDGDLIHIQGNNADYKIKGYPSEEYGDIDFNKINDNPIFIKYADLLEIINSVAFSASDKDTRPVLKGINLSVEEKMLIATATDSFRLSQKKISYDGEIFSATVPVKFLNEVKSVFQDETDFKIYINQKKIQFISESIVMQCPLLEGTYPEVSRLIPSEFSSTLVVNRFELLDIISRASFIKIDNVTTIDLNIQSKDNVIVSSWNMEDGEFKEPLNNVISYEGEPIKLSFSGTYVAEALKAMKDINVIFKFTSEMRPFIIKNEKENDSIIQLILPVKTYH